MSKNSKQSTCSTVNLEFPFGQLFDQLYCPVCGKPILVSGDSFEAPQCQHVEWVYLDSLSKFIYFGTMAGAILEALSKKMEDVDDLDLREEFQEIWGGSTKMVLSVTTGGMACGPVWDTVRFGFNFLLD